ncbi:Signal peptidase complex subunit 2 [Phlyctochytrium planicorne]|nr:Signal peptidase complex subunit 2 [Phlyctochytrium planicorne]
MSKLGVLHCIRIHHDLDRNPVVINHYNSAEVKHALDDALRRILVEDYKFVEDHSHTDRKLLMGYAACLFAAGATLYSHFHPYPDCRPVLIVSVIAYFLLNGAMFFYAVKVEKEIIFVGVKKDATGSEPDQHVTVSSRNRRFTPDYSLSIELKQRAKAKSSGKKTKEIPALKLSKNVGAWFDVDGELAADVFYTDVTSLLQKVDFKMT